MTRGQEIRLEKLRDRLIASAPGCADEEAQFQRNDAAAITAILNELQEARHYCALSGSNDFEDWHRAIGELIDDRNTAWARVERSEEREAEACSLLERIYRLCPENAWSLANSRAIRRMIQEFNMDRHLGSPDTSEPSE